MSEYDGKQFVGIDLHRCRSVIVRMTEAGERLETVRIVNDVERLTWVMARAGQAPEVVLEATYGWYWAVDALVGVPAEEAVRDLVRVRGDLMADLKRAKQRLLEMLLRHGRIWRTSKYWTAEHRRWLGRQKARTGPSFSTRPRPPSTRSRHRR